MPKSKENQLIAVTLGFILTCLTFPSLTLAQRSRTPRPQPRTTSQRPQTAQEIPDGDYTGAIQENMTGAIFRKRGQTVVGTLSNLLPPNVCFRGTLVNNAIQTSRVVEIHVHYKDRHWVDTLVDIGEKVPQLNLRFVNKRVIGNVALDDVAFNVCWNYLANETPKESCNEDPCTPPQYRLVFVARDGSYGGHSFVIWEQFNQTTNSYDKQAYGFYPFSETKEGQRVYDESISGTGEAFKVFFGNATAVIIPENLNFEENQSVSLLRIPVSEITFKKTLAVKDKWLKETKAQTMTYSFFSQNCTAFMNDVVKNVGDIQANQSDSNCPSRYTKPLNPPSSIRPATYLKELIRLNPNREVPDKIKGCAGNSNLDSSPNEQQVVPKKAEASPDSSQQPKDSKVKKKLKGIWNQIKKPNQLY
jgi:hypothetical protein